MSWQSKKIATAEDLEFRSFLLDKKKYLRAKTKQQEDSLIQQHKGYFQDMLLCKIWDSHRYHFIFVASCINFFTLLLEREISAKV